MINQYFGRQNNAMSQPPLDSTPLGMNTNNETTSPIDSIQIRIESTEPTPLILTTDFPEQKGKTRVPGDPDPDPSLSDSSSNKSNFSKDSNSSKSNIKKRNKKKKCRKHKKHYASDSSSSDSDSYDNSDYRRKRRKKKSHWQNDPIKLCAR